MYKFVLAESATDCWSCIVTVRSVPNPGMGCQREIARRITPGGAVPVLAVKDDRGRLRGSIEDPFKGAGAWGYDVTLHDHARRVDTENSGVEGEECRDPRDRRPPSSNARRQTEVGRDAPLRLQPAALVALVYVAAKIDSAVFLVAQQPLGLSPPTWQARESKLNRFRCPRRDGVNPAAVAAPCVSSRVKASF